MMQSGTLPYEYANRGGRFQALSATGLSGILLEQAQFVITAERRKWNRLSGGGGNHILPDFNIYVNTVITPSGPFEPKSNGTTLGNDFYPAGAFILDHIQEIRIALNNLFLDYSSDIDLDQYEYRMAWLQSLWPESPSGHYFATDPDTFNDVIGHWLRRYPSETGTIDYIAPEVLGSSGVMYDIDFGEVMFNPPPHITSIAFDTMHGRRSNNTEDTFNVQQFPLFPAFQKTDGSLVTLTGREPTSLRSHDYFINHISSGTIKVDGYVLFNGTKFYLDRNGNVFDTSVEDFTSFAEGIRLVSAGGNMSGARIFISPTSQLSGVYRIASVNKFTDFPNTTIQSGLMSFWPRLEFYWPSGVGTNATKVGSTTTTANLGYHVFDDCIWMTDTSFSNTPIAYPSGLAILSPFTGHRLWVRYAEVTGGTHANTGWPKMVGLERPSSNNIYRLDPLPITSTSSVSGKFLFTRYNDMLDRLAEVSTTASILFQNDEIDFGGSAISALSDYFYDGSSYWVFNNNPAGYDVWKFDSSFGFQDKYLVNSPTGLSEGRGAYVNSKYIIFDGALGSGPTAIENVIGGGGSGIFEFSFTNSVDPGDAIGGSITLLSPKLIRAENYIGHMDSAEIMDVQEIAGATHVRNGIYAIVRWRTTADIGGGSFYLVRIEETATSWDVKALSRMEAANIFLPVRREIIYMPY